MRLDQLRDIGIQTPIPELVLAAVTRLKAIRDIDSELFINALQSSALLCLAGVRGESPYHRLSSPMDIKRFTKLNGQLEAVGIALFSDDMLPFFQVPADGAVFSFINVEVMANLQSRYRVLEGTCYPTVVNPADGVLTFATFSAEHFILSNLMEVEVLPKAWLQSRSSSHDLRFGMQLGYPGSAIAAYLWETARGHPGHDHLDSIIIDDSMEYCGTQVAFACATSTKPVSDDIRAFATQPGSTVHCGV